MPDPPHRKAPSPPETPEPDADERDSDRPTVNPPFDVAAFAKATAAAGAPADGDAAPPTVRAEQITLTNEVELELARARSAHNSIPPRRATTPPTALSIANARVPSAPTVPAARPCDADEASRRSPSPSSIEAAVLGAIVGSPAPEITERTIDDPIAEMRERFSLGDYSGALEVGELLLAEDPADAEVVECVEKCRTVLAGMYTARLGPLDQVPAVIVQRAQLRWLSIDHRAGFVLSLVDGSSNLETILDMSGMPRLDAMRILLELIAQRIVALR